MKIVVIGGIGLIGSKVVTILSRKGHQGHDRLASSEPLGHRDDLLAEQHAEEPDQGDRGRCWRAHIEQRIENSGKQPCAE